MRHPLVLAVRTLLVTIVLTGILYPAAVTALSAHYTRDAEREPDYDAVRFLVATGINPNGLTTMFQKLIEEQQTQPSAVERWFSTHPLTTERVSNVQQEINSLPATSLRNLATDSRDFQTFRNRVRSLPAARE